MSLPASAQEPKFEYGKSDEVKVEKADIVEWKASAQAGLVLSTGNSRATTLSAGSKASRKAHMNKFQLEAGGSFARSSIFLANDANANGTLEPNEITRPSQTTTKAWLVRGRYDRFLTEHNSLYLSGLASADKPAGKKFLGGGQVGYSRQVYKDDTHELTAETGYDYAFEDLLVGSGTTIHSVRGFLGYAGKLSDDTGVDASLEGLFNLNKLDTAAGPVDRFDDTRLYGKLAITTVMYENISFRFSFESRFDNAPAPRPPFGTPYAPGFVPVADELDTRTEASLIVNFH
jgi:hypothetical protein